MKPVFHLILSKTSIMKHLIAFQCPISINDD